MRNSAVRQSWPQGRTCSGKNAYIIIHSGAHFNKFHDNRFIIHVHDLNLSRSIWYESDGI